MSNQSTKLSIRIDLANGSRFGPGKVELLQRIRETGSIAAAARLLGMSYPRALRLVAELNSQFDDILVTKFHGGAAKGGANLTELGHKVLKLISDIEASTAAATKNSLQQLEKITRAN